LRSAVFMTAISLGRVFLGVLGSDLPGTLNKRFGLSVLALGGVEQTQVVEVHGHARMVMSQSLLVNCQCTLIERLGLGVLALNVVSW